MRRIDATIASALTLTLTLTLALTLTHSIFIMFIDLIHPGRWPAVAVMMFSLLLWSCHIQADEVTPNTNEARVIVKYRQMAPSAAAGLTPKQRHQALGQRLNIALTTGMEPAPRQHVFRAFGISHERLAQQLANDPDVEWAVPDRVKQAHSLPNDLALEGRDQWYLRPPGYVYQAQSPALAAIDAQSAWDVAGGGVGMVVAVLDTGVRYDHPDLASNLLHGYDFISYTGTSADGNGRDADPSDPGDGWYSSPSSWHGTRTAGTIAAVANNGIGIAGVAWGAKVLPVRVLGRNGGYDSDIIAGARWAAGLSVAGVPDNPYPAKVLNLSLGGTSISCSPPWQEAIAEIVAHGSLVVVSAGNESGAVDEPANCPGALAVSGVRHVGTKVGYSSFGPETSISAPAGNCVNLNKREECMFAIDTTVNLGTITIGTNGYTSRINPDGNIGTSFSAPIVSGVAALMLAVNPNLTPLQLLDRIKRSARPFPVDASLPFCTDNMAQAVDGIDNEGQCNCTPTSCGAGLLDAAKAVTWAQQSADQALPPVVTINPQGQGLTGTSLVLDGRGSFAAPGGIIQTMRWSYISGPLLETLSLPQDGALSSFTPLHPGTFVIQLTATDNHGQIAKATQTMTVTAAPGYVPPIVLEYPLVLASGWNLLGNSLNQKLLVAALYGDSNTITSVWKWSPSKIGWQFYAPSMDTATLQSYVNQKGYDVLSEVWPGEGYWVNAKSSPILPKQQGLPFALNPDQLVSGWNLLATSHDVLPTAFHAAMTGTAIGTSALPGLQAIDLTTLWAWDSKMSLWYFYSPKLDGDGTLAAYIQSRGYLDFAQHNKTLGHGTGFWVNMP